jgi:hypothetical protein
MKKAGKHSLQVVSVSAKVPNSHRTCTPLLPASSKQQNTARYRWILRLRFACFIISAPATANWRVSCFNI